MTDDDRLRELFQQASPEPGGVDFAAIERRVRRRRRRIVATASLLTVVCLASGAVAAAQVTSSGSHRTVVSVGPTGDVSCPPYEAFRVPVDQMRHTAAQAEAVVRAYFVGDQLTAAIPVRLADPIANKVKLGSPTTVRYMWVIIRREVARPRPPDSLGPPGPSPGTVFILATLVDDQTLQLGGNFGCDTPPAQPSTIPSSQMTVSTCGGGPVAVFRGREIPLSSCAGAMGTLDRPSLTVPVRAMFTIRNVTNGYDRPQSSNPRTVAITSFHGDVLHLTAVAPGIATITFATIYCAVQPQAHCPALRVAVTTQ